MVYISCLVGNTPWTCNITSSQLLNNSFNQSHLSNILYSEGSLNNASSLSSNMMYVLSFDMSKVKHQLLLLLLLLSTHNYNYSPITLTYVKSGWTHSARFLGNVHGVVVHAIILTLGSSSSGKLTITTQLKTQSIRSTL